MKSRILSILLSSVAFAVVFTGCYHGGNVHRLETDEQLIEAVADLNERGVTRLHPDYIWTTLEARSGDAEVTSAFDRAMSEQSAESMYDLVRLLELRFIHDPEMSVLDLLGPELSEHFRDFEWDPADYPGGPVGPNEKFADVMVDVLDLIRPERRANRSRDAVILRSEATPEIWDYMEEEWVAIPGQEDRMINRHGVEPFLKMLEAASRDGVELYILSSHRTRSTAERNAARANNPSAVASFSAHSLGLAIDFRMSQGDLQFSEITTRPMAEVVRMRESPVHKWLFLRGDEYGWYPYQNEPWHWEYNPKGFREVYFGDFEGGVPERTSAE